MELECVLDHKRQLKRMVVGIQEVKEEVRKGWQDRIERDFEYDGDEYVVVAGKDLWRD